MISSASQGEISRSSKRPASLPCSLSCGGALMTKALPRPATPSEATRQGPGVAARTRASIAAISGSLLMNQ